ncbi:MAG: phosphatidylserine synthase [Acidobacteria bacterium]|nr:MAG: phosphatidylserine synthase [Acidobacteriota bacterium]
MKLLIQPGDGIDRVVKAIRKAKESIEIMIFRFDRPEIERALIDAVERGLFVHALIAFTNHGGEQNLRKLEMRFLESGITVARTAGDLVRYHGKILIVDRRELYVLSFNFTHMDIDRSRGFGIITRNAKLVAEAVRLFEADTKRQSYSAGYSKFVVSPVNARKELAGFIKGARKELLIYDPKISDRAMLRLLDERKEAGVKIRIIGGVSGKRFPACELKRIQLHTRTIIRDRADAFIGSQSLRQLELDARREIGVILRDANTVKQLARTFEDDWKASGSEDWEKEERKRELRPRKVAKKIAKSVAKDAHLSPVAKKLVKELAQKSNGNLKEKGIKGTVKNLVKDVVAETAEDAAKQTVKAVAG